MASTDARPIPRKNVAYRVTFTIYDADGDPVAGAAGLDSEISKDAGTFTDCTNEATQIATSSGVYYLDLTATEMNADTVAIIVKTTTTGAKTAVIVLYPEEAGDIRVDAVQAGGTAWGSGAITAASIASDAITAAKLAADAVAEIVDAVWDEDIAGHQTVQTMGRILEAAGSDWTEAIADAVWDEALAGHGTAGSAGETLDSGGVSAADIADAVWDEATADHLGAGAAGLALSYAKDGTSIYGSTTAASNLKKAFSGEAYSNPNFDIGDVASVAAAISANIVAIGGDGALATFLASLLSVGVAGTVAAGTNTTTVVTTTLPSAVSGFYVGKTFAALTGTNAKQGGKLVTGYDGATKRLTIEALTAPMAAGDLFILVG